VSCSSCRAHRVVLIVSCSSRHLLFANFPLFPTRRAMVCRSKQHYYLIATMGVMLGASAGNAKCGSSIYRCRLDIENRTGLSHYAWNPLRVCECDASSICCDVLHLDSRRDRDAMTCVVRTRPVGKCPDTVRPEGKCPATLRRVSRCRGDLRLDTRCRGEQRSNSHCLCVSRWERYVR